MNERSIYIDEKEILYPEEFKFRLVIEAVKYWLKKDFPYLHFKFNPPHWNSVTIEESRNIDFVWGLFSGIEEVNKNNFLQRMQERGILSCSASSGWNVIANNSIREKMKRGSLSFAITESNREGYDVIAFANGKSKSRSFPIWDEKEILDIVNGVKNQRRNIIGTPNLFPSEIIEIGELYHRQLSKIQDKESKVYKELLKFSKNNSRGFMAIEKGEIDGFVLKTYLNLGRKTNFVVYNEKAQNWFPRKQKVGFKEKSYDDKVLNKRARQPKKNREGKIVWWNEHLPIIQIKAKRNMLPVVTAKHGEYFLASRKLGKIGLFKNEDGKPVLLNVINKKSIIEIKSKNNFDFESYKPNTKQQFIM